jgi:broad specificity phosphatase PhoE
MGAFTGLTNAEVETTYPQWIEQMRAGLRPDPPGAEPRDVLLRRARKGLLRAADDGDRPTLVVTHGGLLEAVATDLGMTDLRFLNLHGYWLFVADDDSMQYAESFPPD